MAVLRRLWLTVLSGGVAFALMTNGLSEVAEAASGSNPRAFHAAIGSTLPVQDQLAEALADAAKTGAAVRLPAGRLVVRRTLWLPRGSSLELQPGAVIAGSIAGQSLVRMTSRTRLSGGRIVNSSTSDCLDVDFAAGAKDVLISKVSFAGVRTNSVYLNAAGLRDIQISDNVFDRVAYGVLLNAGARRASGIHVCRNAFTRIGGDAIEINSAVTSIADRARHVEILDNSIGRMYGSGDSSGFGIGLAGVHDFRVARNRIVDARNEAVHIEDRSTAGVVSNNLIRGGGIGSRPAIAVYRTVSSVVIRRNTVDQFAGDGIAVLWDSRGSSKNISIIGNVVSHVQGSGVVVGGDSGTGPFAVRRNRLIGAHGYGVVVLGTHAFSTVADNVIRAASLGLIDTRYRGSGTRRYTGNGAAESGALTVGSTLRVKR